MWRTAQQVMFCKAKSVEICNTGKCFGTVLCVSAEHRQGQGGEEQEEEEIFCTGGPQQVT